MLEAKFEPRDLLSLKSDTLTTTPPSPVSLTLYAFVVAADVGHIVHKEVSNIPSVTFAGQSLKLRESMYRSMLRTLSDASWFATAMVRLMDYLKVTACL